MLGWSSARYNKEQRNSKRNCQAHLTSVTFPPPAPGSQNLGPTNLHWSPAASSNNRAFRRHEANSRTRTPIHRFKDTHQPNKMSSQRAGGDRATHPAPQLFLWPLADGGLALVPIPFQWLPPCSVHGARQHFCVRLLRHHAGVVSYEERMVSLSLCNQFYHRKSHVSTFRTSQHSRITMMELPRVEPYRMIQKVETRKTSTQFSHCANAKLGDAQVIDSTASSCSLTESVSKMKLQNQSWNSVKSRCAFVWDSLSERE
eukprot:272453-Amphidinium_carterae.1